MLWILLFVLAILVSFVLQYRYRIVKARNIAFANLLNKRENVCRRKQLSRGIIIAGNMPSLHNRNLNIKWSK